MNDKPVNKPQTPNPNLARELGLLSPMTGDSLDSLGSESTILSGGFNEFDYGVLPDTNVNEQRANLQSGWDHTKAGFGRMAGRALTEVLKMPGSATGMIGYAGKEAYNTFMGEGFGEENFGEYVDNSLNRYIESNVAEDINEALPVYTREAITNGSLWDNITSSSFWANEGADGVGFLLSFLAPGAAAKSAGLVGGSANNLGRLGNLAKSAGLSVKTAKNLELGSIATLNAMFESAAEASSGYQSILDELKLKEAEKRRNWSGEGEYVGTTEQEMKSIAGESAASIFAANMGILMFPNFIQAKALFGSAKNTKINKALFNQIVDPSGKASIKSVSKLPVWQRAGGYLSAIAKNAGSEGMWEEGMQYSAEKYFSTIDEEGSRGFFGNVGGIFETYMSELGNLDMQKGIFLGSVLGSPFGVIGNYRENQAVDKRNEGLVNLLRKNYTSFSGNIDLFKTTADDQGGQTIDISTGRAEIDEVKLAKVAKEMQEMDDLVAFKQASDLAGDNYGSNIILKDIATRFAMGYLADNAAAETMMQHANAAFEMNNTPAEERTIVTEHLNKLKNIHTQSKNYVNSLRFKTDSTTTSIEAVRDKVANLLTVLDSRELSAIENVQSIELQLQSTDPNSQEFKDLIGLKAVYQNIANDSTEKYNELKSSKPDDLVKMVDVANSFELFRQWAGDSNLFKQTNDEFDELSASAKKSQASNLAGNTTVDPTTDLNDLLGNNSAEIDGLGIKGKELLAKLSEENADVNSIEQELIQTAGAIKNLGGSEDVYNRLLEKIKLAVSRAKTLNPVKRLFHDINTFSKLYGISQQDRDNLKQLLATVPEKDILSRSKLKVTKNQYPKKEVPGNENFVVVSPDYNWELIYTDESGKETKVGNLPEFNKFKLSGGRYLSEMVSDPKVTEDVLQALTGINDLSKTDLERMIAAQQGLFDEAKSKIADDTTKSVEFPMSDFEVKFHKGSYEYQPKGSVPVSRFDGLVNNQPAGTEFVLIRVGKDTTGAPTLEGTVLSKAKSSKASELINAARTHVSSVEGAEFKSIGSYVVYVKQPSGISYLVAVKSPPFGDNLQGLFDEIDKSSQDISKLLSSTELEPGTKLPLMTDPDKAESIASKINSKVQKSLFIAYPGDSMEIELSVHPKSGKIQLQLTRLVKGHKKPMKSIRNLSSDTTIPFVDRVIAAAKEMNNTPIQWEGLDFFIKGLGTNAVFRKAYPEKTKFNLTNMSEFITSTSMDVVSGQNISLVYKSRPVNDKKTGTGSSITKEQYDAAVKTIEKFRPFLPEGMQAGDVIAIARKIVEVEKSNTFNKKITDSSKTIVEYNKPSNKPSISKEFENIKGKLLSWKASKSKLEVNPQNNDQYVEYNPDGTVANTLARVTSLYPNKAEFRDSKFAARGTVIDDLFRGFIDGVYATFEDFSLAYNSHPNKLDTFEFTATAISDLWGIFNQVKKFADTNDVELFTNLPPFWGKLSIDGKSVDTAGTIDVLAVNRSTGHGTIIDLKTSTQNRRDTKDKNFKNYQEYDEFQQNAYAELINQRLGFPINTLSILPIQTLMSNNQVSRLAQNAGDKTLLMKVARKPEMFKNQNTKPEKGREIVDADSWKSWKDGEVISEVVYKSAAEFLKTAKAVPGMSVTDRIALGKSMQRANQIIGLYGSTNSSDPIVFKIGRVAPRGQSLNNKQTRDRLKSILPSNISVEYLDNFLDRFPKLGNAIGYYQDNVIYLLNSAEQGTQYHEAFHSIFRSVINSETLNKLFTDARVRYGQADQNALRAFGEVRNYEGMSLEELDQLWLEEKLADDFQNYMLGQENFFERIWNRFVEWLGFMFSNRDTIDQIFRDISRGAFVNSTAIPNTFNESNVGVSPVFKLLTLGYQDIKGIPVMQKLNAEESENLINRVAHFVHKEFTDEVLRNNRSLDQITYDVIDEFANLYDEVGYYERFSNESPEFFDEREASGTLDRMRRFHTALTNPEAQIEILDSVKYKNSLMSFKEQLESDEYENFEDEVGTRFIKQNTASIGGFGSLSKWIREYIGFTAIEQKDEFGNSELKSNMPMVKTLDVNKVYNGILRAASNQSNTSGFIDRLKIYRESNPESGIFINQFFSDIGLDEFTNLPTKNFRLFQGVAKQMSMFKVDYSFVILDADKTTPESFKVTNANLQDVDIVQVEQWNNNFMSLGATRKTEFGNNVLEAAHILGVVKNTKTMDELEVLVNDFHDNITKDRVMSLSKGYSRFVVYSNLEENSDLRHNPEVVKHLLTFEDVELITVEDLNKIENEISQSRSPFAYTTIYKSEAIEGLETEGVDQDYVEDIDATESTGAVTRARKIARANSTFDETVGSTSYQNAEGETVYAHQLPTYHLVAVNDLKQGITLNERAKNPFLINNRILRREALRNAFIQGKMFRLDGIRSVSTDKTGKQNAFREQKSGVTFSHMSPREFLLSQLIMAYKRRGKKGLIVKNENGNNVEIQMQPVLIRVLETSSTADFIELPALKDTYDSVSGIKNPVMKEFMLRVQTEYSRISRVAKEIELHKEKGIIPEGGLIENYHTGSAGVDANSDLILLTQASRNSEYRGLRFDKSERLLTSSLINTLTTNAIKGVPLDEVLKDKELFDSLKQSVNNSATVEFNDFVDTLIEEGVLSRKEGRLENVQLPSDLADNLIGNLSDIFFSDWINTISINELLIGDEAKGLKNSVDAVKRAKGSNAAGPNIHHSGTTTLPAFKQLPLGVFKEPTRTVNLEGVNVSKTKIADAQGYMTIKALKHTLHGLGKLTSEAERMLDDIDAGRAITSQDIFGNKITPGSIKSGYQLNSLKLVYYDGSRYIKLSVVPLSKELTSYYDNGVWKPKPGFSKLHDLREEMESVKHEDPLLNGVSMTVPESASKMVSADVRNLGSEPLVFHNLDTNFWRLQLENPSNKTTITDPTQIIQLIDSELQDNELVMFNGKQTKISEVAKQFRSDAAKVRDNDFMELAKSVVSPEVATDELKSSIRSGKITPKLKDFLKTAVSTLSASGADSRLIEFFSPNEAGDFSFNLNMPGTLNKFSELFISYFSKNSLRQKLPGYAVALMSGFGVEIMEEVESGRIIRSEEFVNNPDQFEEKSSVNSLNKTVYTTRPLAHGKSYKNTVVSEFMLPAHFAEFMGLDPNEPIPDEISLMFGIRIPTQDKHSAINLRLVGFLPAYMGSTAIFPDELVALSGADFDIDKMYIHRTAHYVDSLGEIKAFGSASTRDSKWNEFKIWKLSHDKTFKKKYLDLYSQALGKNPEVTNHNQELVEDIEELQQQVLALESELDETEVVKRVMDSAIEMTEQDWNKYQELSAKYSGDIIGARASIFSQRKEKIEMLKEFKEFLKVNVFIETLRYFNLPETPEKLELKVNESGELNNGVLFNRMLEAKIVMYASEGAKAARQSPANLDAFNKINNDPVMEGLFSEDFSYQVDNLNGKYIANKTGREGDNNIGFAVNATIAFNILAKLKAKGTFVLPGINNRKGSKGFIPGKVSYINREGDRVNDLLSNITTAMTDNSKELIAAKYGISKEAIPVFSFMVALGYNFKEAILVINQPMVKLYLENKRRKSSSVITKEEDETYINDFGDARRVAESLGVEFVSEEEPGRTDISLKELVTDIKNYRENKPLSLYSQQTSFSLFKSLEEYSESFSHLNRLVKLVKGVDSNFESIDKVMEAHKSWFSDKNPFSQDAPRVFNENSLVDGNFELIRLLDQISAKIFIERTNTFKTMMNKVFGQLKNPGFIKDAVKKDIKMNLLSYHILHGYKAIVNKHAKPGDWRAKSMSNFLVFDKTAEVLKEDYKKQNPGVSTQELDRQFPSITALYRDAVKEVEAYNRSTGKNMKNSFLSYIVSKEATPSRNFHSLEAKTRVKENPLFMEKIRNGFEELMEGKYGENSKRFAEASIRYLMVKDGFQFKNASFLNLIPSKYLVAMGSTSFPGGSATDRVSKSMMGGEFEAQLGSTSSFMIDRFMKLFAVHPDNQFRLFFLRKGNNSGFGLAKKREVINELTDESGNKITQRDAWVKEYKDDSSGKNYIEFDSRHQPNDYVFGNDEKNFKLTIDSILELDNIMFEGKSGIYYNYRRFFRTGDKNEKGYFYVLTHTMSDNGTWKKIDPKYMTDTGGFISKGARYMKMPVLGMRSVSNIFDVDSGAPTYGQPMTIELQKNYGKSSRPDGHVPGEQQDMDVLLWNLGVEDSSTTDLSSLTGVPDPATSTPSLPFSGKSNGFTAQDIMNKQMALALDSNLMNGLRGLDANIPSNPLKALKYLAEMYLADAPGSVINSSPSEVVGWILKEKLC